MFLDAENMAGFLKNEGIDQLLLKLEKETNVGKDTLRVLNAYADWTQLGNPVKTGLQDIGFHLVQTSHPVRGKNSADFVLLMDVMELVKDRPDIGCFVLGTSDSDFTSLFSRLRVKHDKRVVGLGGNSKLAERVRKEHEFVIIGADKPAPDELVRPIGPDDMLAANAPALAPSGPVGEIDRQQYERLLYQASYKELQLRCRNAGIPATANFRSLREALLSRYDPYDAERQEEELRKYPLFFDDLLKACDVLHLSKTGDRRNKAGRRITATIPELLSRVRSAIEDGLPIGESALARLPRNFEERLDIERRRADGKIFLNQY